MRRRGAIAVLGALGLGWPVSGSQAAPEPPTLVLYPRAVGNVGDLTALIALRGRLRDDRRFQVLTFDAESFAVKRAAAEARHPEWLTTPPTTDADRLAVTRALGGAFLAVVSPSGGHDRLDVHLVEAAPASRTWDLHDSQAIAAAKAIETQAADALAHPSPATPSPPVNSSVSPPVNVPPAPPPAPSAPVTPPKTVAAPPSVVSTTPPVPPPSAPAVGGPAASQAAPSSTPVVTPPTQPPPVQPPSARPAPPSPQPAVPAAPPPDDLSGIQSQLRRGDDALARNNIVEAISLYRQAINGAPRSIVPRLRLAKAYLQGGMHDKALDEAKRALEVSPDSVPAREFLLQMDAETGTAEGSVASYRALVERSPQDASAHLGLGDALWNNGQLADAEQEYQAAQQLAPGQHDAAGRLARLYAAQARYDDSLRMLKDAGDGGYALALGIVQNRADTLSSTLDAAREEFNKGQSTREKFYGTLKTASAQSQALADFVARITPPAAYKLSHLHRVLATNLLAQEAAVLVTFVETADPQQSAKADQLEKDAQTEMLTAHAAEQKLGLWETKG